MDMTTIFKKSWPQNERQEISHGEAVLETIKPRVTALMSRKIDLQKKSFSRFS